jgi:hypothetical protein
MERQILVFMCVRLHSDHRLILPTPP